MRSLILAASLTSALGLATAQNAPEAATPAPAPPNPAVAAELFRRLDANQDGKLSPEEAPPAQRTNFARIDKDGDGFLSPDEHRAVFERWRQGLANRPPAGADPAAAPPAAAAPGRGVPGDIDLKADLPYAGTDNARQRLDLLLPKTRKSDKPLPVVVFIHGGAWQSGSKENGRGNLMPLVRSGDFAGVSVGYRLTDQAVWPAQIHDCKAAIRWIRGHAKEYGLDGDKIAVWGSSAGGHLVSMLGTSGGVAELEGSLGPDTAQSSRVTCVINFFGPEDFLSMVRQPSAMDRSKGAYPEAKLLGGTVQEKPEAAKAASPVTYVTPDDPPFLTAHGTKDTTVPYTQAEEIDAALKKAGVSSILISMEGGGHGFRSPELDRRVRAFLDKYLRGQEADIPSTPIPVPAKP